MQTTGAAWLPCTRTAALQRSHRTTWSLSQRLEPPARARSLSGARTGRPGPCDSVRVRRPARARAQRHRRPGLLRRVRRVRAAGRRAGLAAHPRPGRQQRGRCARASAGSPALRGRARGGAWARGGLRACVCQAVMRSVCSSPRHRHKPYRGLIERCARRIREVDGGDRDQQGVARSCAQLPGAPMGRAVSCLHDIPYGGCCSGGLQRVPGMP